MTVTAASRCRVCYSPKLALVLDLGDQAVSDFLPSPDAPVDRVPLRLVRCEACGLAQLSHSVSRERLYGRYFYRSSVNETMRAELRSIVHQAWELVGLSPGDHVLDIASNDGELLRNYPSWVRAIGVDPSDVAYEAVSNGWTTVHDFFPITKFDIGPVPCKIITAVACLYDLDAPRPFLEEVKRWLHPDGVFVVQYAGLEDMIACGGFDSICHEHVLQLAYRDVDRLLEDVGLRIESWSQRTINGGSVRLIVRHREKVTAKPAPDRRPSGPAALSRFAARAEANRVIVMGYLRFQKASGHSIYGVAASTKFGTLAQWYGLGPDIITAIAERTPQKHGTYTVTGIPIISEEEMRAAKPDICLLGAWQFAEAIAEREHDLVEMGTLFVVPLPELRVVGLPTEGALPVATRAAASHA